MAHRLKMPKLGQEMTEGAIAEWVKQVGDEVHAGEVVASIETDKVEVQFEAPVSGWLRAILVGAGETAAVGQPIAWMTDTPDEPLPDDPVEQPPAPTGRPAPEPQAQPPAAAPSPERPPRLPAPGAGQGRVAASPRARATARELGVDLATVRPTGPGGWVTQEDVERAATLAARQAEMEG
jgi:pyruvate dehydrogenase E2 component (dihydrolipoamide acetyltransferase)